MAKNPHTQAKEIGWTKFHSNNKIGFRGAIQTYKSSTGEDVAVMFNFHEAFILRDEQGLFGVSDLFDGLCKDYDLDIEMTAVIDDLEVIARDTGDDVKFEEGLLEELGLNDFETKESLRNRILALAKVDVLVDIQPS